MGRDSNPIVETKLDLKPGEIAEGLQITKLKTYLLESLKCSLGFPEIKKVDILWKSLPKSLNSGIGCSAELYLSVTMSAESCGRFWGVLKLELPENISCLMDCEAADILQTRYSKADKTRYLIHLLLNALQDISILVFRFVYMDKKH
ncbi:hypothetical protein HN51_015384 [Arachis hypogaea]